MDTGSVLTLIGLILGAMVTLVTTGIFVGRLINSLDRNTRATTALEAEMKKQRDEHAALTARVFRLENQRGSQRGGS